MGEKAPLSERIRQAGGFYSWANSRLIRYAGPPSVGKLTDYTPPPCDGCRRPKADHVESADGSLVCPSVGG